MSFERIKTDWGEEWAFSDAQEFVSHLRCSNKVWQPDMSRPQTWVFRGQPDASWSLEPTLFHKSMPHGALTILEKLRHNVQKFFDKSNQYKFVNDDNIIDIVARVNLEIWLAAQFTQMADDLAFPVDRGSFGRQSSFMVPDDTGFPTFWPEVQYPTVELALARHHGMPSQLLDFTRRPLYAAFFALQRPHGADVSPKLAVWAIDLDPIHRGYVQRVKYYSCPRYQNSFLHHQEGLFLYDGDQPSMFIKERKIKGIETLIAESEVARTSQQPMVYKLTLPITLSSDLEELLWRDRVSKAHLMQTYDNIVGTVIDRCSKGYL